MGIERVSEGFSIFSSGVLKMVCGLRNFFFSILYANLIICSSVLIILEVTSANVVIFLISFYLFQYS